MESLAYGSVWSLFCLNSKTKAVVMKRDAELAELEAKVRTILVSVSLQSLLAGLVEGSSPETVNCPRQHD